MIRKAALILVALLAIAPAVIADEVIRYYPPSGGTNTSGNNAWTGTNSFLDSNFSLLDNADNTKILQFQLSGITTGTTRTLTAPNSSGTIALIDVGQTWTAQQNYNTSLVMNNGNRLFMGSSATASLSFDTAQTPDTVAFGAGSAGNSLLIAEHADITAAFDFAVALQTNPTLVVASATQSVDQRLFIRHNQTQGQIVDGANTAANTRPIGFHGGGAVASAATITPTGNVFHVTGTTSVTSMTAMASGTCVTIIFDGALTFTDGAGTLRLAGNFVTTADDTITLCCDGTTWFEVARAVN